MTNPVAPSLGQTLATLLMATKGLDLAIVSSSAAGSSTDDLPNVADWALQLPDGRRILVPFSPVAFLSMNPFYALFKLFGH